MGRIRAAHVGASRGLTLAALLLAASALGAQEPEAAVFTADVRLVTLPVTVKDARNAPIGDLEREDFTILEEGQPREVAVFERRTNRPLSVALLVDASLSTAIELRYERESANRFLQSLLGPGSQEHDRAAVYSFSADIEQLSEYTRDLRGLEKALQRVRPETGTSVYDAVTVVSRVLERREGRRVIIMVTDGGDTTSRLRFADALRAAHAAEVAIYPLIVLPIQSDAGRNRGGEHALITLARNTGGETFVQYAAADLDKGFGEILRTLRMQYLLGFYPLGSGSTSEESFRGVKVEVSREGATVQSRSGYFTSPPKRRPTKQRPTGAPVSLRTVPQQRGSAGDEKESDKIKSVPRRSKQGRPQEPILRPQP